MEVRLVVAELFNSDWRTDMTKLIVDIGKFKKVTKIKLLLVYSKVRCSFYVFSTQIVVR